MLFERIALAGGEPDDPDPRVTPLPDSRIKRTPDALLWTDEQPTTLVLALEGAPGATVTVQPYVVDEPQGQAEFADDPTALLAARRFYEAGGPITVTAGETTLARAYPGRVCYRLTALPALAATLKLGFKAGGTGEGGKQPRQRRDGSELPDGPGPASETRRCT